MALDTASTARSSVPAHLVADERRAVRGHEELWSRRMVVWCWLPLFAVGVLHYATGPANEWVHNILRRAYYLPIVMGAVQLGLLGGLAASFAVCVTYFPHAFFDVGHAAHYNPAGHWEYALEMLLYVMIGGVSGYLAGIGRAHRQRLEAALDEQHKLQRQLVRAGRLAALGELVAGVSHEIKTPLHALRGSAEIIDHLIPKDIPERRIWEILVSELARLAGIADRFRTFAQPQVTLSAAIDLRDVATRLGELLDAQARSGAVTVQLELCAAPAFVLADRDQLAQVGLNIAVNALRALAKRGGTIRISVQRGVRPIPRTAMHALRIENDGPPIPHDQLDHLFDPFVTGSADGTGLGLSIAQRIVELHSGFIDAGNAGIGVEFTVYLPRAGDRRPAGASRGFLSEQDVDLNGS